jgi:hypothetical protein
MALEWILMVFELETNSWQTALDARSSPLLNFSKLEAPFFLCRKWFSALVLPIDQHSAREHDIVILYSIVFTLANNVHKL